MTIHSEHPFQPSEDGRSGLRRFRSRLPSPVTIWASGDETQRAGLTVSSVLVADGEPGYLVAVLDPLADVSDRLRASGRAAVSQLDARHRGLADVFGYLAPAPGGPFAAADWEQTQWGPVLPDVCWAGGELVDERELGWGRLVTLLVHEVRLTDEPGDRPGDRASGKASGKASDRAGGAALVHRRGRFLTVS